MDGQMSNQFSFINQLLAEKDRLITEKDILVLSKDKLWREMHEILQERDAKIDGLRAQLHKASTQSESLSHQELLRLRQENDAVKRRNADLEAALKDLLAQRETAQGSDESDSESEAEMMSDVDDGPNDVKARPRPKHQMVSRSVSAELTSKFTFAPLISTSDDGSRLFGSTDQVPAAVVHSIQTQLETLRSRGAEGKSSVVPSPQFRSTGCLHNWMMGKARETRWTLTTPHAYACASCSNAGRACLYWTGNMQWIILPLSPAVRRVDVDYTDARYYVDATVSESRWDWDVIWERRKKKK